jgi:tRNA dimethylallyltransferase
MKPKIVIILGPTAVGKTELTLALAQTINAEIVNADSQQVYRYLDIGTGKPLQGERKRVRHHLIDVVGPDEEFNAAIYRRLATARIDEILKRGAPTFVCGGSGLYLKALTGGLFAGPDRDSELRAKLEREIAETGLASLYHRLIAVDPSANTNIHPNDRQRIIRALEVYQSTGRPLSAWQNEHRFHEQSFDVLKIGLERERSELYDLINERSESMIRAGLLEEVRGLMARGYSLDLKPLRSVGYRQMGEVIKEIKTLPEALEEMKQETRRLAKRQLTWFRSDPEIRWFHPEKQERKIADLIKAFLL